jgi:hypothetical protein
MERGKLKVVACKVRQVSPGEYYMYGSTRRKPRAKRTQVGTVGVQQPGRAIASKPVGQRHSCSEHPTHQGHLAGASRSDMLPQDARSSRKPTEEPAVLECHHRELEIPANTWMEVSRVAQSVQCLATGWTTGWLGFDPRQRRKDFSCSLCVQTGFGAHPSSFTMDTVGSFSGTKAQSGRHTDDSPPSTGEVENE